MRRQNVALVIAVAFMAAACTSNDVPEKPEAQRLAIHACDLFLSFTALSLDEAKRRTEVDEAVRTAMQAADKDGRYVRVRDAMKALDAAYAAHGDRNLEASEKGALLEEAATACTAAGQAP